VSRGPISVVLRYILNVEVSLLEAERRDSRLATAGPGLVRVQIRKLSNVEGADKR
jgi:hypothetical protein